MTILAQLASHPDYAVCSDGRVCRVTAGRKVGEGELLAQTVDDKGYKRVELRRGGKRKSALVNRLVCETFHGSPPTVTHQAAHNDGNRTNNSWTNLRWATPAENTADKHVHGTHNRGSRNPRARLSESDVEQIRAAPRAKGSGRLLAAQYAVRESTISQIRSGKLWPVIFARGTEHDEPARFNGNDIDEPKEDA